MAKSDTIRRIRNIGVAAHIDAGKTTVTERILYYTGRVYRIGNVDDGNTVTDYLPEERERGITIVSAAVTVEWKAHQINLIDTPGHVDFTAEVERSLRVLDGAVIVFCGVGGVEAQSETVWRQANKYSVPRICFVNKMDRVGSDADRVAREIETRLKAHVLLVQMPIGRESSFSGIIDLVRMKALNFIPDALGKEVSETDIPAELKDEAEVRRDALLEAIATHDDEFAALYLENGDMAEKDVKSAIRRICLARTAFPVFMGSGLHNIGIQPLLDAIVDYLPSPADIYQTEGTIPGKNEKASRKHFPDQPLSAYAFKNVFDTHGELVVVRVYSGVLEANKRLLNATRNRKERPQRLYRLFADRREEIKSVGPGEIVGLGGLKFTITGDTLTDEEHPIVYEEVSFPEPVVSMAVEPRTNAERDKLKDSVGKLCRQDPTLAFREDEETGELVLRGMGELHLEIVKEFLQRDYHVEARFGKPRVSYREQPEKPSVGSGTFDMLVAGKPLYAVVNLSVRPIQDTRTRLTVEWSADRDKLPQAIVQAVEDGITGAAGSGPLRGEPIVGAAATVTSFVYHVDKADEGAFAAAGARALEQALNDGGTVLLEPVMKLEVLTPAEFLGNIIRDLGARKAQVTRTDVRGDLRVVEAFASLEDMFGYANTLRSLSQGRAAHTMEPYDYRRVPDEKLKRLLAY